MEFLPEDLRRLGQAYPAKCPNCGATGWLLEENEKASCLECAEEIKATGPVQSIPGFMAELSKTAPRPFQPNKYFEKEKFIPKLLGDEILEDYAIQSPEAKDIYFYNPLEGIYQPFEGRLKAYAQARLGERTKRNHIDEVSAYIRYATFKPDFTRPEKNLIALQNGVMDLNTKLLYPFDPKYFFTSKLPIAYDPTLDCPKINNFLAEVIGYEGQQFFYELAGYCLYRDYPIQKAIMLVGEGANGKSTSLRVLEAFLGRQNVSTVTLQELSAGKNRFAASLLQEKLANICDDLPKSSLKDTGTFKMLTGGGTLNAERKFKDAIPFTNHAKLIFSANQVPATSDDTHAFFRRWQIIPFNKTFPPDKADTKLVEKLTTPDELSGLLNKALEHLPILLERGQFSNSKATEEVREAYIKASDPIMAFNLEKIADDQNAIVSKDTLYHAFVTYCNENGLPAIDKPLFGKRLQRIRPLADGQTTIDGVRAHVWKNIKLL